METVLIADDEAVIRNGLKYILDWEAIGYTICGEASNGTDTLDAILSKNPSLVLLDIRMPKMQGIDIIVAARAHGYKGHVIILSGYSDFKYAQAAIKHGVDFYLTKPIDEEELLNAVTQVKTLIERNKLTNNHMAQYKEKAKHVILQDLLTGNYNDPHTLGQDIFKSADVYQVVIYENYHPGQTSLLYNFSDLLRVANQRMHFFEHILLDNRNVILLKGTLALQKFTYFLSHYDTKTVQKNSPLDILFLVFGRPVYTLSDLELSYQDGINLLRRRFFCKQGQHTLGYESLPAVEAMCGEISEAMIESYSSLFCEYLKTFSRQKTVEALSQLEDTLYNCNSDINTVKRSLSDLYFQIKEHINHTYSTIDIPFPSNASVLNLFDQKYYLYEIIQFFSEQFEMIMNATGSQTRSSVIEDVLFYIDHNFTENIKLESIAPLYGYNSAYLGKIFSKTVGESFNAYVDHKRITYSKTLLTEETYKVYEIAEMAGYKNVDYFHKKFRKYVGESPAEYRKRQE